MKRFISVLLALFQIIPTAFAEEEPPKSAKDSISAWFRQATEDTTSWASQAWQDTSDWASQAWEDTSTWATQAWIDASTWSVMVWNNVSASTIKAWDDSSKWVSQAWTDSSQWAATNWDRFVVWVNTVASGDPYSWVNNVVLDNGAIAFDALASMRSFLDKDPSLSEINKRYNEIFSDLSLLNEDKDILWSMIEEWTDEKGLPLEQTSKLALPFLVRLLIEGESVIGEGAAFSGPVVGQYILTILEAMSLDSAGKADMRLKILSSSLENLTRPTIIGDTSQNTLVTDDHYYIENFTYLGGKYQVFMIASKKDATSRFPMLRGETIQQASQKYFKNAEFGEEEEFRTESDMVGKRVSISHLLPEATVTGEAVAIWTQDNYYLLFFLTHQGWDKEEFANWFRSISLKGSMSIAFEVDLESDGSFYGVNQVAQKYTINRIFDEARFSHPTSGHGWAAERGNNLIDNLKGVIKRRHSTVIGDNNAKNSADRVTYFADGSKLSIQTKYYATASRSISACFEKSLFRYMDHEGKPMAIEVPANQYEAAVEYMKRRIANGQVPGVTDIESAVDIVKRGNLT